MTGERVDRELQHMDAAIFDEFIDTMECNLYCRCGAPNDAVQKMASAILSLRAQVAALAGDAERWRYVRGNGYVVTRTVTIADKTQCFAGRVGDGFADACVDAMMAEDAARGGEG